MMAKVVIHSLKLTFNKLETNLYILNIALLLQKALALLTFSI
jgi:hypothetical protein